MNKALRVFTAILLLVSGKAEAAGSTTGQSQWVVTGAAVPTGFQQVSVSGTAVGFTPPANTQYCVVTPETNAIRFRTDGVNPTATVGMPVGVGSYYSFRMSVPNLTALRFIAQTATSTLNVDCYRDY